MIFLLMDAMFIWGAFTAIGIFFVILSVIAKSYKDFKKKHNL